MPAQRLVIKFGGTSVGHGQAIAEAAEIAADLRRAGHPVIVVASAMSAVTDALLGGAAAAVRGERVHLRELTETLRAKHHAAAGELELSEQERPIVLDPVDQRLAEFAMLCDALAVLGEASPRAMDAVSSLGERMSVHLLAGALRKRGTPALPVDATELVRTDDAFQAAAPDMVETRRLTQEMLAPMLAEGIVPVVTGFIGATSQGVVTTLGRGGSDYSAAIIGAAMDADEVWIYTDVDGVMTADPRVVAGRRAPSTRSRTARCRSWPTSAPRCCIRRRCCRRSSAASRFGSATPSIPTHPGTLVVGRSDDPVAVFKGVTAIRHQSLVTIEGRGMLGVPGIAARAFGSVARTGTSVSMISQASSEQSICFLVPQDAATTVLETLRGEFEHELARRDIESIWALDEAVIVTVVGAAIKQTPGVAGRVFGALGPAGINVIAIAMGSSECSISLVVEAKDAEQTVQCLHTLI